LTTLWITLWKIGPKLCMGVCTTCAFERRSHPTGTACWHDAPLRVWRKISRRRVESSDRHDVDESGGSADTEPYGISASLRVVDSPDGRYGWAADDPRWTEPPDGAHLWDPADESRSGRLGPDPRDQPRFGADVSDGTGPALEPTHPALATTDPPVQPPVRAGFGLPAQLDGAGEVHPSDPTPATRPPRDAERDARVRRRRRSAEDEFRRTSRAEIFGEEPSYTALFGLTAGWYALPAVAYLVWLLVGGDGRLESLGAQVGSSLPWLGASMLLSFAVAGLLRWAAVGWRALTLSFAAAVIGAGVTTIAHTLAS
jgi:hypothetical protein